MHSLISNKIIRLGFYSWLNLLKTMPKMQVLVTHFLSWTMAIILVCLIKKTLILVLNQNQLMNYQMNFKNSYWFFSKTSIMLKNFKHKPMIRAQSLKAILLVTKFGRIANIIKLNKIKSWKHNFLIFFKFYI